MDSALVVNALYLVVSLVGPLLIAILVAGVIAGFLQAATQISDPAIGFTSRFAGVAIALYIYSSHLLSSILSFAQRLWGGMDYYF